MFYNLKNIIEVNFTNFDSSGIKNVEQMFYGCSNLKYVNISKFNNNLFVIKDILQAFKYCESLISF